MSFRLINPKPYMEERKPAFRICYCVNSYGSANPACEICKGAGGAWHKALEWDRSGPVPFLGLETVDKKDFLVRKHGTCDICNGQGKYFNGSSCMRCNGKGIKSNTAKEWELERN